MLKYVQSSYILSTHSLLLKFVSNIYPILYIVYSISNICSDFRFLKHRPQASERVVTDGNLKKIITVQQRVIYVPKTLDI